jgi:hypothetical protein
MLFQDALSSVDSRASTVDRSGIADVSPGGAVSPVQEVLSMSFGLAACALANFGEHNGMQSLSFDSKGCCHFVLDGHVPVTVRHDPVGNRLSLLAQVEPRLPIGPSARWLESSLAAALNPLFDKQPGMGWHPELGLVAFAHVPLIDDEVPALDAALIALVEWIERWRKDNVG